MNRSLACSTTAAYRPGTGCGGKPARPRHQLRRGRRLPGQARRRGNGSRAARAAGAAAARHLELVGVPDRLLAAQVDHPDLIRQVQHQVPLAVGAADRQSHRLELERQVVPERAVKPQVRVRAPERGGDLPQHAEHGRPARPLLLGERPLALGHVDGHRSVARPARTGRTGGLLSGALFSNDFNADAQHRVADDGHQNQAALVERPGRHLPAPAHDLDRRVHVGQVPAGIPAWVLHARAEHAAAAAVDQLGDPRQLGGVKCAGGTGDRDATADGKRVGRHRACIHRWASRVRSGPVPAGRNKKRPPLPGGR